MKRMLVVVVVVMALLAMTASSAFAMARFALVAVDDSNVQVVMDSDDSAPLDTWYIRIELDWLNSGQTVTLTNNLPGLGLADWGNSLVTPGHVTVEGINMSGTSLIADGTVLFNLHSSVPAPGGPPFTFDYLDPNFMVNDSGNGWDRDGATLMANSQLGVDPDARVVYDPVFGPPPVGDTPVPPISEIVTIVLVSLGLIALGGYVWYRRHRQVAAVAA